MKRVAPSDLGQYFSLPNPGLLAYFSHVRSGSTDDYRPPFWEGKTRAEVLEAWSSVVEGSHVDDLVPGLLAFEIEARGKVGPMSIMAPLEKRVESIEQYYTEVNLPSQPVDSRAIASVLETLRGVKAQVKRPDLTVKEAMRLSTNSGSPYFTKRRSVIEKTLDRGIPWNRNYLEPQPAVLGWRGQEGGPNPEDVKQRVVWMFPFAVNIAELSAYSPLIRLWQHRGINSAYQSMRHVEMKITRLFDTKGDEYCVVTDFSKFDQHFNAHLQEAARQIVSAQLHLGDKWMEEVFPIKYNIPLICDKDLMYTGAHGMGSGSGGTNFDECCAHAALQHEAAILAGSKLNPFSNAYGDDGYLSYPGIDVDHVISTYSSHGQVLNPDKQSVDKHSAVYLRRYFHDSYRDKSGIMLGVYSTFRALGRLLAQERFVDPSDVDYTRYLILRAYSILENCANHPLFEKFVDFVMEGDRYALGLRIPGFLDSLPREVKKVSETIPDILGYTKTLQGEEMSGISDWKVVKYIRAKANSR